MIAFDSSRPLPADPPFLALLIAKLGLVLGLAMAASGPLSAQAEEAHGLEFFENEIRPLLAQHCYECHSAGAKKLKANLSLDSRAGWETGGDSGPAIVPGKPEESLLIRAVSHTQNKLKMPPKKRLADSEIEALQTWITMGAPDPREGGAASARETIDLEQGREFWSFQRPSTQPVPQVKDQRWPANDIDRFILARLEADGLTPAGDAPRLTLVRRLYYDLIGLPPSPGEVERFLADRSPRAIENLVDDLLARPEFGERWGRHWLDVARFAESSGGGRSLIFPQAWRYRDYVIDSFNDDKPYDEFIREQIAGDVLQSDSRERRNQQIIGSGYLVLGPINYELQDDALLRMEVVDEQVDAVGRTFLGMTLGCARCHDHKFDPIPTTDYYALAGIFESTTSLGNGAAASGVTSFSTAKLDLPDSAASRKVRDELAGVTAEIATLERGEKIGGAGSIDPQLVPGKVVDNADAKIRGDWTASQSVGRWVGQGYIHNGDQGEGDLRVEFSTSLPDNKKYEVLVSYSAHENRAQNTPVTITHADGETTVRINQRKPAPLHGCFVSVGAFPFSNDRPARVTIGSQGADGVVIADAVSFVDPLGQKNQKAPAEKKGEPQGELDKLKKKQKALERQLAKGVAVAMAVSDSDSPADSHVRIRGQIRNLGEKVPRGFISAAMEAGASPEIAAHSSGRLELANWIASADNPLSSRVLVNRVWMHLLGEGIVSTPDNFGQTGELPSHPELLDFLALRFVADGWSIKKLIREIALSRTYQLSSHGAQNSDPENRLFGRANRKRLEAECIRDTALVVSGRMDPVRGGLTMRKPGKYDLSYKFDTDRRSIYVPWLRNSVLDLFEVFDAANPNLVIGKRSTSNLPTQALYLMNSPFIREQSEQTAGRLIKQGASVADAYQLILCRPPSEAELAGSEAFLAGFESGEAEEA